MKMKTATWAPAMVYVDATAYGPYRAEIDVRYSLTHTYEWPRFDRQAIEQLMADHQRIEHGTDPHYATTLGWDGETVVITIGAGVDGGDEDYTETVHPDEDGCYPLLPDWRWSVACDEES